MPTKKWELWAAEWSNKRKLLDEGWEPFAVLSGVGQPFADESGEEWVYFRRQVEVEGGQAADDN